MCGRYTQTSKAETVRIRFGITARRVKASVEPNYNLAPGQTAPVVTSAEGERTLEAMRWGLVPSWARDETIGNRMINARAETAAEKPAFRRLLGRRRCLVAADGFYEWQKVPGGRVKIPVRFVLRDRGPFAMAGLWDAWRSPDGGERRTFTILTTEPNELAARVHNRMPVILRPEDEERWLDPEAQDASGLRALLVPYPAGEMEVYRVSTMVNSPRNNDPACIEPVPEQGELL